MTLTGHLFPKSLYTIMWPWSVEILVSSITMYVRLVSRVYERALRSVLDCFSFIRFNSSLTYLCAIHLAPTQVTVSQTYTVLLSHRLLTILILGDSLLSNVHCSIFTQIADYTSLSLWFSLTFYSQPPRQGIRLRRPLWNKIKQRGCFARSLTRRSMKNQASSAPAEWRVWS